MNEGAIQFPTFYPGGFRWKRYVSTGLFDNDKKIKDYTEQELDMLLKESCCSKASMTVSILLDWIVFRKRTKSEIDILEQSAIFFPFIRNWICYCINPVLSPKILQKTGRQLHFMKEKPLTFFTHSLRVIKRKNIRIPCKRCPISVSIPKNKITSVVGVSGSGKSALVFDT